MFWIWLGEVLKIVFIRVLYGHRGHQFTHGVLGVRDQYCSGRGASWMWRSSVLQCASAVASGQRCYQHAVHTAWDDVELYADKASEEEAWHRMPFAWTGGRSTWSSVAFVVPFAERQFDAAVRWIQRALPSACGHGEGHGQVPLALYVNTRFTPPMVLRILRDIRDSGAIGRCLTSSVYFLEARLDGATDRYARNSWLSERDSAGTGNMFYPLLLSSSFLRTAMSPSRPRGVMRRRHRHQRHQMHITAHALPILVRDRQSRRAPGVPASAGPPRGHGRVAARLDGRLTTAQSQRRRGAVVALTVSSTGALDAHQRQRVVSGGRWRVRRVAVAHLATIWHLRLRYGHRPLFSLAGDTVRDGRLLAAADAGAIARVSLRAREERLVGQYVEKRRTLNTGATSAVPPLVVETGGVYPHDTPSTRHRRPVFPVRRASRCPLRISINLRCGLPRCTLRTRQGHTASSVRTPEPRRTSHSTESPKPEGVLAAPRRNRLLEPPSTPGHERRFGGSGRLVANRELARTLGEHRATSDVCPSLAVSADPPSVAHGSGSRHDLPRIAGGVRPLRGVEGRTEYRPPRPGRLVPQYAAGPFTVGENGRGRTVVLHDSGRVAGRVGAADQKGVPAAGQAVPSRQEPGRQTCRAQVPRGGTRARSAE
eukprot:ctg_747.g400